MLADQLDYVIGVAHRQRRGGFESTVVASSDGQTHALKLVASTEAATADSTAHTTRFSSHENAHTPRQSPTSSDASTNAKPDAKQTAASSATSPATSTDSSNTDRHSRLDKHRGFASPHRMLVPWAHALLPGPECAVQREAICSR